jgi:hypothetical protein
MDGGEIVYLEPGTYTGTSYFGEEGTVLNPRDFELSSNSKFVGIHGFMLPYDQDQSATHVYFLGFEPSRIEQAIQERGEVNLEKYKRHFVIGLPSFVPGWENNVLAKHHSIFKRLDMNSTNIHFCAANSVREAYLLLWNLYAHLGDEYGCMWVSPLGTKPHAVASSLFLMETLGATYPTSLYHDHPMRVSGKSERISDWHVVRFNGLCGVKS